MRVCVVNIMPLKQETELQLCRMLARAQVPVQVTWCVPDAYAGKNSAPGHIQKYYSRLSEVLSGLDADPGRFDAFIVVHGTDTMAYTASAVSFCNDASRARSS